MLLGATNYLFKKIIKKKVGEILLSGNYFTYNNVNYETYGLMFANVDNEEFNEMGGNFTINTFQNNNDIKNSILSIKYDQTFSFDVSIVTKTMLSISDIATIQYNLFNQKSYKKLILNNNSDFTDMYFNCIFTNPVKIVVGGKDGVGCYGFKLKMTCDSQFVWKDIIQTFNSTQLANNITVTNNSSNRNYTYPTVKITSGSTGGDISIQCITDNNRIIALSSVGNSELITMSHFPLSIKSSQVNPFTTFNNKWVRLIQSNNVFHIDGDIIQVQFIYSEGRVFNI